MAVNMTKHDLRIFDNLKKEQNTNVLIGSETNSYINMYDGIKAKLYMQRQGYSQSQAFSFQEVGMPNVLKMVQEQRLSIKPNSS